jgi:hypothetical protein
MREGRVPQQGTIDECRASQMYPGKAPFADNGYSIGKDGNAAWVHLGCSLWACREEVIHGVVSLGKGVTITRETRLVANPFPVR